MNNTHNSLQKANFDEHRLLRNGEPGAPEHRPELRPPRRLVRRAAHAQRGGARPRQVRPAAGYLALQRKEVMLSLLDCLNDYVKMD